MKHDSGETRKKPQQIEVFNQVFCVSPLISFVSFNNQYFNP